MQLLTLCCSDAEKSIQHMIIITLTLKSIIFLRFQEMSPMKLCKKKLSGTM